MTSAVIDVVEPKDGGVRLKFNNNRGSDAPVAAERFKELLDRSTVR